MSTLFRRSIIVISFLSFKIIIFPCIRILQSQPKSIFFLFMFTLCRRYIIVIFFFTIFNILQIRKGILFRCSSVLFCWTICTSRDFILLVLSRRSGIVISLITYRIIICSLCSRFRILQPQSRSIFYLFMLILPRRSIIFLLLLPYAFIINMIY